MFSRQGVRWGSTRSACTLSNFQPFGATPPVDSIRSYSRSCTPRGPGSTRQMPQSLVPRPELAFMPSPCTGSIAAAMNCVWTLRNCGSSAMTRLAVEDELKAKNSSLLDMCDRRARWVSVGARSAAAYMIILYVCFSEHPHIIIYASGRAAQHICGCSLKQTLFVVCRATVRPYRHRPDLTIPARPTSPHLLARPRGRVGSYQYTRAQRPLTRRNSTGLSDKHVPWLASDDLRRPPTPRRGHAGPAASSSYTLEAAPHLRHCCCQSRNPISVLAAAA